MKKILVFIILFIPFIVSAASVQTGKFSYMPAFADETEETYYYSDDYFKESGKEENDHLLTMSYNLALSTFEIRGSSYVTKLYVDIGFKNIVINDMEEKPTLDTVGTAIASKKVGNNNIVAVAIRGEKYDSEWGNNFIVGESGDAKGFSDSSAKVIARVKQYIADNNLDNVKLWIVGYSRAGAIANLMGVYINNHLDEFNTNNKDLYIYTFEAPAASKSTTKYDNIYNVKSSTDIIPFVYPESWGFHTNGKVITIGEDITIKGYTGLLEQIETGDVDLNTFYGEFFTWLTSRLTREQYHENLEGPLSEFLDIYFSKSSADRERLLTFITTDVKDAVVEQVGLSFLDMFERNSDSTYTYISSKVVNAIESVRGNDNGNALTDEEYQKLETAIPKLLRVLGPIIVDDYYYYDGINYDEFYAKWHPKYNMTDLEYAYSTGKKNGYDKGYNDGFDGEEKDDEPPEYYFNDTDTPQYKTEFIRGFKETYSDGYDEGYADSLDPVRKGRTDGINAGQRNGEDDGTSGRERNTDYERDFAIPYFLGTEVEKCSDVDPEDCSYDYEYDDDDLVYIEQYKSGFAAAYQEAYDTAYAESAAIGKEPEATKSMYHFMTIIKNVSTIMERHHPQENLTIVQARDSYYLPNELLEGDNQSINLEKDEDGNLTFRASSEIEKFVKARVDNSDVDEKYIEAKSGSTIVTLKNEFLKTLSEGEHSLELIFIDSVVKTNFTVEGNSEPEQPKEEKKTTPVKPNKNPNTGDRVEYDFMGFGICLFGLLSSSIYLKKKVLNSD